MAVGFSGITFDVRVDDVARLPYPTFTEDGAKIYAADVYLHGTDDLEALEAMQRKVTVHPAIGRLDSGTIVIEGTGAFGTLVVPLANGDEGSWRAVLRRFAPLPSDVSELWLVSVEFVCGNRIT